MRLGDFVGIQHPERVDAQHERAPPLAERVAPPQSARREVAAHVQERPAANLPIAVPREHPLHR